MKRNMNLTLNVLVKIFLFPLVIVGMLLRIYDKLFKKNQRKRQYTEDLW